MNSTGGRSELDGGEKIRTRLSTGRDATASRSRYRRSLRLEPLEDRRLLAVVTVDTDQDVVDLADGLTSLREAIFATNLVAGADEIRFDFGHDGPATIRLTQGELRVSDDLTITGDGPQLLTIDASGNDPTPDEHNGDGSRVFRVDDGSDDKLIDVTLSGMTITGGDTSLRYGGGIFSAENLTIAGSVVADNFVTDDNSPQPINAAGGGISSVRGALTIRESIVRNNAARALIGTGGGIYAIRGDLRVIDSTIQDNSVPSFDESFRSNGGGIFVGGSASISNSEISGNTAESGGGLFLAGDSLELSSSLVSRNSAVARGGGLYAFIGDVTVFDSVITRNMAGESGGGLGMRYGRLVVDRSTITRNTAAAGGGISAAGTPTIVSASRITENTALDGAGGGLSLSLFDVARRGVVDGALAAAEARVPLPSSWSIAIERSTIENNLAGGSGGGVNIGVSSEFPSTARVVDTTFSGNSSGGSGGGLAVTSRGPLELEIVNSTVSGNLADAHGGGVFLDLPGRDARLAHSTIALNRSDNDRTGDGHGGGLFVASGAVHIDQTIIATNSDFSDAGDDLTGFLSGQIDIRYSLIGDSSGTGLTPAPVSAPDFQGNIIGGTANVTRINPRLGPLAPNGGPTRTHVLLADSPAIDRGDPAAQFGVDEVPTYDQRGAPYIRVYGGRIDIGAFEQLPGRSLRGDYNFNGTVDQADYIVWRMEVGAIVVPGTGADGNGDGVVDYLDYAVWRANLGVALPPPRIVADDAVEDDAEPSVTADVAALALSAGPASSQVGPAAVTVTTDQDVVDLGDGLTSLREAIFATNLLAGPNEICFDFGHDGPATIVLTQGELRISDDLTITGDGPQLLTIDASGNDPTPDEYNGDGSRVFNIDDSDFESFREVTLRGLTLTGGDAMNFGGAIICFENLTLFETVVDSNAAIHGGGIYHATLNPFVAPAVSQLRITESTISNNVARPFLSSRDPAGGYGGGVFSSGALVISDSLITGNRARLNGGIESNVSLTVTGSTISNNEGGGAGGVFSSHASFWPGATSIAHSTITGNSGGGGARLVGGNTVLDHTIIAANSALHDAPDLRLSGDGQLVRYSLIGDNTGSGLEESPFGLPDSNGNLIGGPVNGVIDPLLGSLTHNGGPTLTHTILPGSPAINRGNLNAVAGENGVPSYDQRGLPFDRIVDGRIDIGAFEVQSPNDLNLLVDTLADELDGDYSRGDLSLREAIALANDHPGHDTIRFDPRLTAPIDPLPARILLTRGELQISDSVAIVGLGADQISIDANGNDPTPNQNNGDGSRVFRIENPNVVIDVTLAGLTLTGGDAAAEGGAIRSDQVRLDLRDLQVLENASLGPGGGIYVTNSGVQGEEPRLVTIVDSLIRNNAALTADGRDGSGGGIYSRSLLDIVDSTISGNLATESGGGLYAEVGLTTILRSTIDDNSAGVNGGGILNRAPSRGRSMSITESTISGNTAGQDGGGLHTLAARTEVSRSTFNENSAARDGGGVWNVDSLTDSTLNGNVAGRNGGGAALFRATIINSTFSGNVADALGGGIWATTSLSPSSPGVSHSTITRNRAGVAGGGIFISSGLTINNTIVADNSSPLGPDLTGLLGTTIDARYNLIGSSANSGLAPAPPGSPDTNGNIVGAFPSLRPLADNGGPTKTHTLDSFSNAIGAGDPDAVLGEDGVPFHDQRGAPFIRIYGLRMDIGAVAWIPSGVLPGDFDRNGVVEAADYVLWRMRVGSLASPPGSGADANADALVNNQDYAIWRANLGSVLPALPQNAIRAAFTGASSSDFRPSVRGAAIRPATRPDFTESTADRGLTAWLASQHDRSGRQLDRQATRHATGAQRVSGVRIASLAPLDLALTQWGDS